MISLSKNLKDFHVNKCVKSLSTPEWVNTMTIEPTDESRCICCITRGLHCLSVVTLPENITISARSVTHSPSSGWSVRESRWFAWNITVLFVLVYPGLGLLLATTWPEILKIGTSNWLPFLAEHQWYPSDQIWCLPPDYSFILWLCTHT